MNGLKALSLPRAIEPPVRSMAYELWRKAIRGLDVEGHWVLEPMRRRGTYGPALARAEEAWRKRRSMGERMSLAEWMVKQGVLEARECRRWAAEAAGWQWCERKEAVVWAEKAKREEREELDGGLWALVERTAPGLWRVAIDEPSRGTWARLEGRLRQLGWQAQESVEYWLVEGWPLPRSTVEVKRTAGEATLLGLLESAVEQGASDVHFIPREQSVDVRFRIDGRLFLQQVFGPAQKHEILAHAKMAGGLDIGRPGTPLDGGGGLTLQGRAFKLRYSSMPTQFGQQVVVRLLDQEASILSLSELGMSPTDREAIEEALRLPQGLIYLVGPTGCGKTTTLATLLNQLDGANYSLRTLENPIEYRLAQAVQAEVGPDMGFAESLRALLRQDPDFLLVGETRDRETAEVTVEAGLTGHLCFSTVHGNDAVGGIVRLLDPGVQMGPLLAACHLFIGQRLVRRLCSACARPREDRAEQARSHRIPLSATEHLLEPVGCPLCREGYRGRIAVFEVRRMSALAEIVQREGAGCALACRRQAEEQGWSTMYHDGLRKALAGLTTLEEVQAQVPRFENFP